MAAVGAKTKKGLRPQGRVPGALWLGWVNRVLGVWLGNKSVRVAGCLPLGGLFAAAPLMIYLLPKVLSRC